MRFTFSIGLLLASFCGVVDATTLDGIVTIVDSGQPLAGATVRLAGTERAAETDAFGRFRFSDLPQGDYRIEVRHVGYHTSSLDVAIGSDFLPLSIALVPQPIPLDDLSVTAHPDPDIARQPAFSVIIPREAFEGRATTLPEVLSATTGVQVRSLGGMGAFSTISVRGSSSEQVDVYLDGISLNTALGGGIDLSNLPLSHIGRIEVRRGAGQDGHGLGGTVHIRTRAIADKTPPGVFASWGSFDTRSISAVWTARSGRWRSLFVVDYAASDNDFPFLDDNGTEYNANDDAVVQRRNSDVSSGSVLAKSRFRLTEARSLSLHQTLFWKRQGIPGLSNNQSTDARFDTFRSLTEIVYEDRAFFDRLFSRQTFYFTHTGESFEDIVGEVGVGRQNNEDRTRSIGWRTETRWPFPTGHLIRLITDVGRETFDPTAHIQLITPLFAARRMRFAGGTSADLTLPRDIGVWSSRVDARQLRSRLEGRNPFAFSPQAPDSSQTQTSISASTGIRIDITSTLSFRANTGRSERAPSFYELFGDRGGVVGNTRIRPERAYTWDTGFRYGGPTLGAEAAYFDHRYNDLIQFFQTSQATSRPHNIGKARVRGLELSGSVTTASWAVGFNYTLQDASDRSNSPSRTGKTLPNRPRHALAFHTTTKFHGVSTRYDYTFQGGNFLDPANRRPLDPRHLHGAVVHLDVSPSVRLGLEARNITNAQINDVWGYPLPGRAWFVNVQTVP